MADELFAQLLECSWRGISFPIVSVDVALRQDLVQHKYPGVDGANVEGTGRAPLEFRARIPFRNGVFPGKNERWSILYPDAYRLFQAAMADSSTGVFQHPELGPINCKPIEAHATWSATSRDGVDVDASWIETEDQPTDTKALFVSSSPVTEAVIAGTTLDTEFPIAKGAFPKLPTYQPTLGDTLRSITGVTDQAAMLSRQAFGRIDAVKYRLDTMAASVSAAKSSVLWPVTQDIERAKAAIIDLKKYLAADGRPIVFYAVQRDTTLANLARLTGAAVGDLVKLNPSAVQDCIVPRGTIVRYYRP
jgi:DNA circularisation protein N-terminus